MKRFLCSKGIEARRSTISPQRRRERRGRKRSTCMSLTISDQRNLGLVIVPHVRSHVSFMYISAVDCEQKGGIDRTLLSQSKRIYS